MSTSAGTWHNPSERFGSWTTRLFVLFLFIVLTLGMTWPLVLNLRTAVPGAPWDNLVWLYDLWWFRHSIVELNAWPKINPMIFYPFGYDLRLSETMLANKALIAPLLFWGDEVLAYNALLLISFVLTGYATYLLIAYLTDNRYAAVVGGAAFAFCPYRMHAMAAGWLPLISTQWMPLAFLYLERTLRERRARYALAAGFFIALNVLSSWYYLYVVGAFAALYVLIRLWPWTRAWRDKGVVSNVILMACVTLVMLAPVAAPMIAAHPGDMGWPLSDVEKWAASLEDFFLPNVYHPLWGEHFLSLRGYAPRYPWYTPGFVYLGIVPLLLAALVAFSRRRPGEVRGTYLWLGIVSFVLALGVVLHWNGEVLEIRAPPTVEAFFARAMSTLMSKWALHKASYYDIFVRSGAIPIPLPALLIYLFVPLGSALRTLYRFGVITTLAVAVLAGMGAARVLGGSKPPETEPLPEGDSVQPVICGQAQKKSSSVPLKAVLLLGLVLLDFCSAPLAYGFTEVKAQPLDHWLAAQPDSAVIMQFPLVRALSGASLYRSKYHGKRMTYGHGTFYPEAYSRAMPVLGTFPSEECLSLLRSWGVSHIVVGSQAYDAGWGDAPGQTWDKVREQIESSSRLRLVSITRDEPFWRDERISGVIYGNPPVTPVLVDKVYVYELQ